ncbi:3-hydroxyacyl-CoA dehydrogenase [Pusillimonas caeni]|uniref:3-hydroxyacyl-CoA dehydrogenase n=1 Tax=Pusillimonas caeni TaxID=1348472 RepID=UPI000E59DC3B|nr:3-hydroxyacyl-CoA dehydrogenase [Pusillimonas caeni]TFL11396.1 3-hydroxyacyl-CoA dehydrogenase [Pusillimonas caeni]
MTQKQTTISLGIVGAGAMGAGIAHAASASGIDVRLVDAREGAAQKACEAIGARLDKRVGQGKLSADEAEGTKRRLAAVRGLDELKDCDVVVEAIIEDLDAKAGLFEQLEDILRPEAVLASNTSSIPIGALAAGRRHRGRIAGMHFFNPVPLMKLVEVIAGPDTEEAVLDFLVDLGRRMGKTPVRVRDTPGFLVNFGGRAYPTEALAIVQEGVATPAQIDAVMRDCHGFRMGPFELMDLTGMDVNFPVTRFVHECYFYDPRLRSTPLHRYMVETGQLGRKAGRGFFRYEPESEDAAAEPTFDAEPTATVFVHGESTVLRELMAECGAELLDSDDGRSPILIAPLGEDCTAYVCREGLDRLRTMAIDTLGDTRSRVTLMAAPGAEESIRQGVASLLARRRKVTLIGDSPGFIGQRMVAMVANLGCEMAQSGVASVDDIDCAMRLGLNYPSGPLEMADALGVKNIHLILQQLQALTGDDRYRPSQWLRRRAQLGVSARVF